MQLKVNEECLPINLNKVAFGNILNRYFDNDPYAM